MKIVGFRMGKCDDCEMNVITITSERHWRDGAEWKQQLDLEGECPHRKFERHVTLDEFTQAENGAIV